MDELENDLVISRWCDSSAGIACDIPESVFEPGRAIFRDERQMSFAGLPAARVFAAMVSLGGENGWSRATSSGGCAALWTSWWAATA